MLNSRLLPAAACLALLVGAPSGASAVNGPAVPKGGVSAPSLTEQLKAEAVWGSQGDGSLYRVTVVNKSSRDVWVTYYNGPYQFEGQAGTQCIPPGKSDVFAKSSWQSSNPEVRVEKKAAAHCGGDSTDDRNVGAVAEQDGSSTVTVTDSGPGGIGLSFRY